MSHRPVTVTDYPRTQSKAVNASAITAPNGQLVRQGTHSRQVRTQKMLQLILIVLLSSVNAEGTAQLAALTEQ